MDEYFTSGIQRSNCGSKSFIKEGENMINEKRRQKRSNIKVQLLGQLLRKDKRTALTNEIPVLSKDISRGGIRLSWPKSWKCGKCSNCLGWVFNFNCRFKSNNANRINRIVDRDVVLKVIFQEKDNNSREVLSRVVWTEESQEEDLHYDVGLNFVKLDKGAEEGINYLIKDSFKK